MNLVFDVWCFSLKMEFEKLAQEKTEMQRHYVMVSTSCQYLTFFLTGGSVVEWLACWTQAQKGLG